MDITNCCFLLSKAGFCYDILFIFRGFLFTFFSMNTWLMHSLTLSCMRCVDNIHSLASVLIRLVFSCQTWGGGDFSYFVCEALLKGLMLCWQMLSHSLHLNCGLLLVRDNTWPLMFLYIVLQHCCLLVEFEICDMKHLLFCTAWINYEEDSFAIYFS